MNIWLQCNSNTKYPELLQTSQVEGVRSSPPSKLISDTSHKAPEFPGCLHFWPTGYKLGGSYWPLSVRFQGKPFSITVIQVYAPTSNAEEAEVERFYEELQDLLELTLKKRYPFHYRGLECKSRKLRDTWNNRQVWPWCTKWSRSKDNRVLPTECTGHSKHPLPT